MKAILKSWWEKFYSFYSDPKRALSVVLVVCYVYFIFAWITAKIYTSPILSFLNRMLDIHSFDYMQVLISFVMILYLHQRLGSLHKKRVFFQFFFLSLTLSVLCFPYSMVIRNSFFAENQSKYEEAMRYAVTTYEQTGKVRIILPEEFDGLSDDRMVFVLRKKDIVEKVFFPIAPGLITEKGFVCEIGDRRYQHGKILHYRFLWGSYTREGLSHALWGTFEDIGVHYRKERILVRTAKKEKHMDADIGNWIEGMLKKGKGRTEDGR